MENFSAAKEPLPREKGVKKGLVVLVSCLNNKLLLLLSLVYLPLHDAPTRPAAAGLLHEHRT